MRTSEDAREFATPQSVVELAQWAGLMLQVIHPYGSPPADPSGCPAEATRPKLRVHGDPAVVATYRDHVAPFRDEIIDLIRGPPYHGLVLPHNIPVTAIFGHGGRDGPAGDGNNPGVIILIQPGEPTERNARSEYLTKVARSQRSTPSPW